MAILKHFASKSSNYGASLDYVLFDHDEKSGKVLRDANGNRILRRSYWLDGVNCDPFLYAQECKTLNNQYNKNQKPEEIKSHHYILSFDPKDVKTCGLTGEKAQSLGLAFAKRNFPGHQMIVCTHADGSRRSGNIHVHIFLNSLRKIDVEASEWSERAIDSRAGYKHHVTKKYLQHLKQDVMNMCREKGLHQVDLLARAEQNISDREYYAVLRGQDRLDKETMENQKESEITVTESVLKKTRFQTQKQYLREAIDECAKDATTFDEFYYLLSDRYKVKVIETRGRFSYLHPDRNKNIRARALGAAYEKEALLEKFLQNCQEREMQTRVPISFAGFDLETHPILEVLFIESDLRLVPDLQKSIKEKYSHVNERKILLSTLQEEARTVAFVQMNNISDLDELENRKRAAASLAADSETALLQTQKELKEINRRTHYTGQFLDYKDTFRKMTKVINKGKYRREHEKEIRSYEEARDILRRYTPKGKFPSLRSLQEKKTELTSKLAEQEKTCQENNKALDQLSIASQNIKIILGYSETTREHNSKKISEDRNVPRKPRSRNRGPEL